MNAPIKYIPNFVTDPDQALIRLQTDLDWERRGDTPRSEYYCNDHPNPYQYGKGIGRREYIPRPYTDTIMRIRNQLEAFTGTVFEVCFLNRYHDQKDQLGWHADNSHEMDDTRPIATISLGVEREIWFRAQDKTVEGIEKVKLGHGSVCLMAAGMQDTHFHRIPKAGFLCGERISLTFRGYLDEKSSILF